MTDAHRDGPPPDRTVPDATAVTVAKNLATLGVGLGSVLFVFWTPLLETPFAGSALLLGTVGAFYLAYRWALYQDPWFLRTWVAASLALALLSATTGYLNGVTDEPYGTPGFVRIFPNLYGPPLHLNYVQYGTPSSLTSSYIYLPLLTFVQVPGLDYRWVTIAAWLATVFLVRAQRATATLLGSAFVGLLAAEGFNDFVPLLGLTLTFVTLSGWRSRVAEVVSLGLKQFANVIVVLYFAWHRRWWEVLFAIGVTAAFLLPFAFLDPGGTFCHAILLDPSPSCSGSGSASFLAGGAYHLNYYLWPLWVLAVFGARYVAELRGPRYSAERSTVDRWRGRTASSDGPARASDLTLLVAPFVRLGSRLRRRRPAKVD
jgi:hypothetical protein